MAFCLALALPPLSTPFFFFFFFFVLHFILLVAVVIQVDKCSVPGMCVTSSWLALWLGVHTVHSCFLC